ncbi:MAG TPA: hypothetical protein VGK94_12855 [Candidatus Polarisedimenticolia bacterium]|jgi:hypothetical protein
MPDLQAGSVMLAFLMTAFVTAAAASPTADAAFAKEAASARQALRARHGERESARIDRGIAQVLRYWRPSDGDAASFGEFARAEFLPEGSDLDATFARLEFALERIGGYFTSMERDLRRQVDLDLGPILPIDERLAAWSARAHVGDDLFDNKVAFVALLNFPLSTLQERLSDGLSWSRRRWAETRLAQGFSTRVPAEVNQKISRAFSSADTYISTYNIVMHHLLDDQGRRLFPEKLRLITHWGLRDELKAHYADPDGVAKQRMIQKVMERIVRQEIPAAVIDNPLLDWAPFANKVTASGVKDLQPRDAAMSAEPRVDREPDERYRQWLGIFQAVREADPYHPDNPTFIDRRFNVDREIPEPAVKALFESILRSPLAPRVGRLIEKRLGRKLEPFDIWYVGFKPRGRYTEAELDAATRKRYPTPAAYAADIPRLLRDLGFSLEQSSLLADHIEVDPSRGAGHALGATRRDDKAHLRTRVGPDGMDYKGYNIAVHEMGHNVEQVFSVTGIDHTLLQGVPNTAFTEALAFVFQGRDLELLGLSGPDPSAGRMRALEEFWATREIAGVGLTDMAAWRWLYDHPQATPAQFREAVVSIAGDIWNRYYSGLLGAKDLPILAIYSHMIDAGLYTPDYPLGHLIAFQIEDHFRKAKPMGAEFERICKLGSITPDAWMRQGVGGPLSAEPLLAAAAAALDEEERK